jgi:hypothetical protein
MSNLSVNIREAAPEVEDPFADPVAYLAAHGIEAELVETRSILPEAA